MAVCVDVKSEGLELSLRLVIVIPRIFRDNRGLNVSALAIETLPGHHSSV
jgi:hypothetical protein